MIGGGFAAAEEAVFLTKYAKHVTILMITDDFTCSESVTDGARNHPPITVHYNTEVEEVPGDSALRSIRYRNNVTGEVTKLRASEDSNIGVFKDRASYTMPILLRNFREKYPVIRVDIFTESAQQLRDALKTGCIDLLLLPDDGRDTDPSIVCRRFIRRNWFFVQDMVC